MKQNYESPKLKLLCQTDVDILEAENSWGGAREPGNEWDDTTPDIWD